MRRIALVLLLVIPFLAKSQHDPLNKPNTYQASDNPYYWKNKLPYEGYWQQDVHYTIKARVDDSLCMIDAPEYSLEYWNNSPDTLENLYFHLYQNAFTPGSNLSDLYSNNKYDIKYGENEVDSLGTEINHVYINGDTNVRFQIRNSIMKVQLPKKMYPNTSINIEMSFKTYYGVNGSIRRRMKTFLNESKQRHFDGVHWYPIICVYDYKFGWTSEQHLDKEFYANFGTFDVELTFPSDYIVEATGNLTNHNTVYPDSLFQKIQIENYIKDKSYHYKTKREGEKTWVFHAENVHNFAFTADPLYRIKIDTLEQQGDYMKKVNVITLVREPHALNWKYSGAYTRKVVDIYSKDFGTYIWPKIIIADAEDGMEYPMLTLDGRSYPGHKSLLAHEVGHMWFYGMVGSNETYRAFLDEGFTQFLTVWSMDKIGGESVPAYSNKKEASYKQKHRYPSIHRYRSLYYPYIKTVTKGYDEPLNTHSSGFNGAIRHSGGYGLVYYKTGVMLYNLRYVLGEELFLKAIKNYTKKFTCAHPYPEDFRNSVIQFTKIDLNWFFDQWLETSKNIDYSIKSVKNNTITFQRRGRMQMPLDFIVITKEKDTINYHIPNTWFVKDSSNTTVLSQWYGWDNINKEYSAEIDSKIEIDKVIIDPGYFLADIDLTNNSWNKPSKFKFDHKVVNYPWWYETENFIRPDLWYNSYDGLQVGAQLKGNYFKEKYSYQLDLLFNTGIGQNPSIDSLKGFNNLMSFRFTNKHRFNKLGKEAFLKEKMNYEVGLTNLSFGLEKTFRKQGLRNPRYTSINASFNFMRRNNLQQQDYLFYTDGWSFEKNNSTINLNLTRHYTYKKGMGDIKIELRTPGIISDFNYNYIKLEAINSKKIAKFHLNTRFFARATYGDTPIESSLYLAGANPESMIENPFTKAPGMVPDDFRTIGESSSNFQMGGGLNLRGYSGRVIISDNQKIFVGQHGSSINLELDFNDYFRLKPKGIVKNIRFESYLFSDVGLISDNNNVLSPIIADAGIGFSLAYKNKSMDIERIKIRFDLPFWLSHPESNENNINSRFVVGLNRTF